MLESLIIKNSFAHKHREIKFNDGFTAITGKNGSGKSEILDMIRFSLFGSGALRTAVGDYKNLFVSLVCKVKGQEYTISRGVTTAKMYRGEELIALGTKPVNLKVIETFGYGMNVFDVANVARQNKLSAMSNMTPSERKRMVDATIGLDVIDEIMKWCVEESKTKAAEALGMKTILVVPVEPEKPENYMDASALSTKYQELQMQSARAHELRSSINREPSVRPEPARTEHRSVNTLRLILAHRASLADQLHSAKLELSKHPLPPQYSLEQLDLFEKELELNSLIMNALRVLNNPVAPLYNLAEIDEMEAQLHQHDSFEEYHRQKEKGHTVCPACNHLWYNEAENMARCGDWEGKSEPPIPALRSLLVMEQMRRDWEVIETQLAERAHAEMLVNAHGKSPPTPTLSYDQIAQHRKAHAEEAEREIWTRKVGKLMAELAAVPDVGNAVETRVAYDRQMDLRAAELEAHTAWQEARAAWQTELDELGDVDNRLEALAVLRAACSTYDHLCQAHAAQVAAYQAALTQIDTLEAEADQLRRARTALATAKAKVKTHLVPNLSKVASILLRQMTGGLMNDVAITHEFDITVDGKIMDALSGAEAAASNLAIRIGLGQVLTNRVFSVFMADEVDKDMDGERAPFMAACLRNLTKTISQVVLVSHKDPEADQIIAL